MTLSLPKFTKINENFICLHCGFQVPKAQSTCRDHCPKCLYSLHVDLNPGDRSADCGGLLVPVSYFLHKKKGIMINYVCEKCGALRLNKFLEQDSFLADDLNSLLIINNLPENKLSTKNPSNSYKNKKESRKKS